MPFAPKATTASEKMLIRVPPGLTVPWVRLLVWIARKGIIVWIGLQNQQYVPGASTPPRRQNHAKYAQLALTVPQVQQHRLCARLASILHPNRPRASCAPLATIVSKTQ